MFDGASHCDFDAPTDWQCRPVCGGTEAGRQQATGEAVLRSVD